MAITLAGQTFRFRSGTGADAWYFVVTVNSVGKTFITDIQPPNGQANFDQNFIPDTVITDMNTAIDIIKSGSLPTTGSTGSTGSTGFFVL